MIDSARTPRGGNLLLEFGAIPLRRWRLVASALVLTLLGSVLVTLLVRPSYLTSTTIVPFSGGESRSQIALGNLPAGVANLVGASFGVSPAERLVNVLIGSRMLNVAPWPGSLSTVAAPSWASAMCWTSASPIPEPRIGFSRIARAR